MNRAKERDHDDGWILEGHAEVRRSALDAETFSSQVSRHLQIPNGLDGDEHRRFRALVEKFLTRERVAAWKPAFERIAEELVERLPRARPVEIIGELGALLAVRSQRGWLGWSPELEEPLLGWMRDHRAAVRSRDPEQTAASAARFDAIVRGELERHRRAPDQGGAWDDTTAELLAARVEDPACEGGWRGLRDEELVSILRNWTAGDLGSIAASVGCIAHQLAARPDVQWQVRGWLDERESFERALDELLRIDDPFLSNRRVTTRAVECKGRLLPAGSRVVLHWAAANRDPEVFPDPDAFRPAVHASDNLVYGIGPHVCPGRALATLQLAEGFRALLAGSRWIELAQDRPSRRAEPPAGGYEEVWIVIE